MSNLNNTIFIAGGGTGGHLFPAISIGDELEKHNIKILYIGSKYGIERKFYEKNNLKYYLLNIVGLQRGFNIKSILKNLLLPILLINSFIKSFFLIKKHKPLAIIGTGGYSSGLPLLAGIVMKIPTFIQEQNSIPGLITKILNKGTVKIFTEYNIKKMINNQNCIQTGNPIRNEIKKIDKYKAKEKLGFDKQKKLLLIIGGSQGAKPINAHFLDKINFYIKNDYQILWQCGKFDYELLISKIHHNNIKIKKFINNMSYSYSAADLVISRAGAIAISEITYMGKAMILIPFPQAAENHQYINAEKIESLGACYLIEQNKLSNGNLEKIITKIFNNTEILSSLEKKSLDISKPNATKVIVKEILESVL